MQRMLLDDPRNLTAFCHIHHFASENWSDRFTRDEIPPAAWEFADELGMRHVLERLYP